MTVFLAGIGILVALIALGVPIGYALGIAGALGVLMIVPLQVLSGLMAQVVIETVSNYVLLTIPMFILMAEFLNSGGMAQDVMLAMNRAMRRVRGGLAMACVFTGVILAAASGSSTAAVASISRAAYPTMKAVGYQRGFAIGTIAITGTLAILIPPSVAFIVYGYMTEEPVGLLFAAGLLPGLVTALGYVLTIMLILRVRPGAAPGPETLRDSADIIARGGRVWPVGLLVLVVLVCLYGGVATPTEIGGLGALGALLIGLSMRRITGNQFVEAIANTLRTSTMIVTIIFCAHVFGFFISFTQITDTLLAAIRDSGVPRYGVLLLIVLIYLLLGMIMDQLAIIILTAPIAHGVVTGLGFDGIWFGVLVVKTAEIGLVTPPLGLNVFIASSTAGVPARDGFAGVMPFVLTELVILGLLILWPGMATLLPSLM